MWEEHDKRHYEFIAYVDADDLNARTLVPMIDSAENVPLNKYGVAVMFTLTGCWSECDFARAIYWYEHHKKIDKDTLSYD